jgi:hypothetical protein
VCELGREAGKIGFLEISLEVLLEGFWIERDSDSFSHSVIVLLSHSNFMLSSLPKYSELNVPFQNIKEHSLISQGSFSICKYHSWTSFPLVLSIIPSYS